MRVLTREFYKVSRRETFKLYPLGDVHIGSAACNEKRFRQTVEAIKKDDHAIWIGTGDYCDFISLKDPRFGVGSLAGWIDVADLLDLARAQRERFLEIVEPIASKCVGLVCGNHETALQRHYERDVYSEIVSAIKEAGEFDPEHKLALGFYGWLRLRFHRQQKAKGNGSVTTILVNVHHGFVNGRLAGAKALNMQRWLWTHDADLVIFGHSHNQMTQPESVEKLDRFGKLVQQVRRGMYSGTYHETVNENGPSVYSEVKGYFPNPTGSPIAILKPGKTEQRDRVRVAM